MSNPAQRPESAPLNAPAGPRGPSSTSTHHPCPTPGSRRRGRRRLVAAVVAFALVAAACSDDADPVATDAEAAEPAGTDDTGADDTGADDDTEATDTDDAPAAPVTPLAVTLRPSVEQLHVLDAEPGTELELRDSAGSVVDEGTVDELGSLLWRAIAPGDYLVSLAGDETTATDVVTVTSVDDVPDPSLYTGQELADGFGYITTRDGTTLSANVVLPGPAEDGPYPTVVEYSGYQPSNPDSGGLAQVFTTMGYAYVGVNMRGTGCSGGSFRFFEPIQRLDGYDAIETVAAQSWVKGNRVGMVGVSYPGISQLFVASTQPPSLAAITPLSVLDDSARSTLYPGGILNTGFAVPWSDERENDAQPFGQGWEQGMVDGGDTVCEANQRVRLQNPAARDLIEENPFYDAAIADDINPTFFAGDIEVPVFLAGAWQDEQTGGRFPAILDDLTAVPQLYATMVNGVHTESITPAIAVRWMEFLELYVAQEAPDITPLALVAPVLTAGLTGVSTNAPDLDRLAGLTYEEALATYEADPRVRILFEQGAADGTEPGTPLPRYEASFDTWPPAEATAARWYLTDGGLSPEPPGADLDGTTSSWTNDPGNVPATTWDGPGNDIWLADVALDWQPIPAGTGVEWISEPLAETFVAIGPASLDLWLSSDAADTDLEVTVSEVRPDGSEVYVQSGWLRASRRAIDEASSTETRPVQLHLEADAEPLVPGELTPMRIEIFPFAHAFRAGSQLRITIDAPGGSRPVWDFDTIAAGETNTVAHDADHPSALVLSVVPGVDVPADPPACGALRAQPCRDYVPLD